MTVFAPRRAEVRQDELRALLAAYLADVAVPSRMKTVRELARASGASIGAVQGSLARLAQSGAVTIESRRGSGMVLAGREIGALWSAARAEPMVVAMAAPITLHVQGLATAIKAAMTRAGIDTFLTFSRGSRLRLQALHARRCHAVVMSALGAAEACGANETIVLELPDGSNAAGHQVYERLRADAAARPLRVAVDRDSVDLQKLTEMEFAGERVEFITTTYLQFADLIRDGRADAAIWDVDEVPAGLPPDVVTRPLSPNVQELLAGSNTRAAVVVRVEDGLTAAAIRESLGDPLLLGAQREVVAGIRLPEY